eukprot:1153728-Pelagomonas_calceolata.AAC.8
MFWASLAFKVVHKFSWQEEGMALVKRKENKVYAGLRPRALREGSLTSRLAGASPEGPQTYNRHS